MEDAEEKYGLEGLHGIEEYVENFSEEIITSNYLMRFVGSRKFRELVEKS